MDQACPEHSKVKAREENLIRYHFTQHKDCHDATDSSLHGTAMQLLKVAKKGAFWSRDGGPDGEWPVRCKKKKRVQYRLTLRARKPHAGSVALPRPARSTLQKKNRREPSGKCLRRGFLYLLPVNRSSGSSSPSPPRPRSLGAEITPARKAHDFCNSPWRSNARRSALRRPERGSIWASRREASETATGAWEEEEEERAWSPFPRLEKVSAPGSASGCWAGEGEGRARCLPRFTFFENFCSPLVGEGDGSSNRQTGRLGTPH